ncbi:uncharacterized protein LOC131023537 [Salvia miltiorrhiza]|uniref:uncharacterized protein LOC131023537 n=1 Tax=Salvia miltiorrhiza TaxID=226208 RepID=UPI0025AB9CD5|nr:uncharacterized protein LOC131023537 [Salvia miltiorrhiza]
MVASMGYSLSCVDHHLKTSNCIPPTFLKANNYDNASIHPYGGFFTVKFSKLDNKRKAKEKAVLELSTSHIRLREWNRYFNPYKDASSLTELWMRIYYLSMWTQEIIVGIGYELGRPLCIDHVSAHGVVGHFARVLVEVDMAQPFLESMYIDDDNNAFYIELGFETLSLYCSHCKITGHSTDKCRKVLKSKVDEGENKAAIVAAPKPKKPRGITKPA